MHHGQVSYNITPINHAVNTKKSCYNNQKIYLPR
jgi:hypothetical protein